MSMMIFGHDLYQKVRESAVQQGIWKGAIVTLSEEIKPDEPILQLLNKCPNLVNLPPHLSHLETNATKWRWDGEKLEKLE